MSKSSNIRGCGISQDAEGDVTGNEAPAVDAAVATPKALKPEPQAEATPEAELEVRTRSHLCYPCLSFAMHEQYPLPLNSLRVSDPAQGVAWHVSYALGIWLQGVTVAKV